HQCDAGLVVEMARNDVAVVEELELGVDRDDVTGLDAMANEIGGIVATLVDAQFDEVPADRQAVHLAIEGMAGCLERQDRATKYPLVREHGAARAFGEARGPVADRHDLEPAVVLESLDHRAQGVEMGDDRAGAECLFAGQAGADLAASGQLGIDAEMLEFGRYVMDDRIGVAGGAGDAQQALELREKVLPIDIEAHPQPALAASAARRAVAGIVCGNSRSMKRCAVGCGSWLASPGRSLASMKA